MLIPFILALLIITYFLHSRLFPPQPIPISPPTTLEAHRSIADFSALGANSLSARLRLRALPNARLITAFGLVNSFTTTDRTVHALFLRKANAAIRGVDWAALPALAENILDRTTAHLRRPADDDPRVPLAALVRTSTLVLVLAVLFGTEPRAVELKHAQAAAEAINRLWLRSKSSAPSAYPASQDADRALLAAALERLLPEQCAPRGKPADHPLNLIIPAFETLWRVVLLAFVAATDTGAVDAETSARLAEAAADVQACCYGTEERRMVALGFAKEGLRLYPPTKRIKRALLDGPGIVEADVEKCHRDTAIWGADALRFRPARFDPAALTPRMRRAYMPFGVGKHQCPAAAGFGERMVALLILVLVRRFGVDAGGKLVRFDGEKACEGKGEGGVLPSCRHEMEAWTIRV
ncbi:cytochrome P450 [Camillea tinctor]|nr:cytochrome P450 [Camillea tinctor]